MSASLPNSIATFFEASNGAAPSSLPLAFSEHAVVHDEGRTHQGHEAIQAWLADARRKFTYRVEPLTVVNEDGHVTVVARCVGNFPGSPVELTHVFRLTNDVIDVLEIR